MHFLFISRITEAWTDNIRNDLLNHILDNDNNDIENLKMIFMDFERSEDLASYILEGLDNRIN